MHDTKIITVQQPSEQKIAQPARHILQNSIVSKCSFGAELELTLALSVRKTLQ